MATTGEVAKAVWMMSFEALRAFLPSRNPDSCARCWSFDGWEGKGGALSLIINGMGGFAFCSFVRIPESGSTDRKPTWNTDRQLGNEEML
jgi:hypothetical protein